MDNWSLIGLLASSVALLVSWYGFQARPSAWRDRLAGQPPLLVGAARLFYFIGLPYLAILLGLLSTQQFGLTGLEYLALVNPEGSNLIVQIYQTTSLLLLAWLLDSGTTLLVGGLALLFVALLRWGLAQQRVEISTTAPTFLPVLYQAVHWAFYRALCWAITQDFYLGVVLGGLVALLEMGLIDLVQGRQPLDHAGFLHQALLLSLTATVFYFSPNLWLLLPIHWALAALIPFGWPKRLASQASPTG
ncbi:MAG TPA: hypothetical protein PKE64_04580 [Anaerolineae bacterium]|nr:hypothetical protein [Anaerolineae bacterium]HMR63270.1 hypothetical protein [Anaerolineae bacterium]